MKCFGLKGLLMTIGGIALHTFSSHAQVNFSAQYMGRGEYRHGYQALADTSQKAATFVSQRARLTADYTNEKFKMCFSAQDVRTWGSVVNNAIDNKGLLSIAEAYGELYMNKKATLRVGRQILSYDDDRILGSLDWAMQARRHDAALFKYTDSTWAVHVGAAFNQPMERNKFSSYTIAGNYKTMQFLWANKVMGNTNLSLLFLNNGYQYGKVNPNGTTDSMTVYSQTAGVRGEYKEGKFRTSGYVYYQMGKDAANRDLGAYDASIEFSYKPVNILTATLGGEILSGTSQTDTANRTNHSFNPFYGTNHRFNGYMDYFYVGNHINSVGLVDAYFKVTAEVKKTLVSVNAHMFSAASDVKKNAALEKMPTSLGTEIDFTFSYNVSDNTAIQGGYSRMFGTDTMKKLKGGQTNTVSDWAYLMLIIRPGKMKWPKTGLKM